MIRLNPKAIYKDIVLKARGPKRLTAPDSASIDRVYSKMLLKSVPSGRRSLRSVPYSHGFFGSQKSIAKVSYQANQYKNQWKAHGRYLARAGAQRADERGEGFDQKEETINIARTLADWQDAGDSLLWKVIISPEEGHKLDLKDHVRAVMEKVEGDLKTTLQWVAIDHHNTDHPHAHVTIRGLRQDGKELNLDRAYFTTGFRARSCEEATKALGLRQENDILKHRELAISRRYVTELDREIERRLDQYRTITFDKRPGTGFADESELQLKGRLNFLENLGLAEKEDAITWKVSEHHLDYLKHIQIQNDIVHAQHKHMDNILDKDLPVVANSLSDLGDKVLGRVVGMGVNELNEDGRYLIVEGVDKQVHYIEATNAIEKLRDSRGLQDGDIIYLERREMTGNEPPRLTQGDFSRAGLDGKTVFDTLVRQSVLELKTPTEAELVQNRDVTGRVVKALFPDKAEKVMAVLEDAHKIRYLHVNRVEDFQEIRRNAGTHDIDRYILDMVEKTNAIPQLKPGEASVRSQFLEIVQDRIDRMQRLGVITRDLKIDMDSFERKLNLEKGRGLELQLELD